jgi:ATP-dependent DNA ligase
MELPLVERRQRLEALLSSQGLAQVVLSQGIVGSGCAFFQETCRQGLEGMIAKRLQSRYLPGKRTDAWQKIKRQMELCCAIVGFVPAGTSDFRSLIIAVEDEGQLRCIGKVGSGFSVEERRHLNRLLGARLRDKPLVPSRIKGKWIEPGLFCRVSCMERTAGGELRAPVFKELIEG